MRASTRNRDLMGFITDFKFALRSLARVKGLAVTVIVTLALGIGANAAIFSVVRGVLLRPWPTRTRIASSTSVRARKGLAPRTPIGRFRKFGTCAHASRR